MSTEQDTTSGSYTFRNAHRPILDSGIYTLTVKLDVTIYKDTKAGDEASTPSKPREREDSDTFATKPIRFLVAGERFSLKPADIHAVYPPDGSRGTYEDCLPHIALNRDTLPWERSADGTEDGPPWLALLLLHEVEAATYKLQTVTVGAYRQSLPDALGFKLESGQTDADTIQIVELPADLAFGLLPSADELALLCHVRGHEENGALKESVAMVVSKRLPKIGLNTAHLVSLEHRFVEKPAAASGQPTIKLVSLKSWSFSCEAEQHPASESLDMLLAGLKLAPLRIPAPTGNIQAEPYLSRGLVALPHRLRTGESAVSWYRGPLLPSRSQPPADLIALPTVSADSLLLYHDDIAMLDTTYAAAWELGRMLALQNRRISASLGAWRRRQLSRAHQGEALAGDYAHLPQVQRAVPRTLVDPPPELTSWIDDLRRLRGIPFKYLVADERMLPPESIRCFTVDPLWLDALLDGALSIVRLPTLHGTHYREAEAGLLGSRARHELVTGFLLRSAAVAGWPGLQVRAQGSQQNPLELYRRDELAPTILIGLFVGEAHSIVIQQKPETLHLALDEQRLRDDSIWQDQKQGLLNLASVKATSSSALAASLLHQLQSVQIVID
jgi:hypothetical protein